jgi:carbonic anhydrase
LKRNSFFIVVVAILLLLVACSQTQPTQPAPTETTQHEETEGEGEHAVRWGYEGEGAPEHWADLDPDYAVCGTGVEQSPIDIANATTEDLADIVFNYSDTTLNILNNGHTIQVNYDEGSSIEVKGTTYDLLQFHFHTPSEHEIDGQPAAGEMHLVHQSDDGSYAVIGVMIQDGTENLAFAPVWDNLPAGAAEVQTISGVSVNAADLLPDTLIYYNYSGSFTTPPCTEGVNWLVLTTPIEMSDEQIAAFSSIIGDNNRPVQPLGDRSIVEDSSGN